MLTDFTIDTGSLQPGTVKVSYFDDSVWRADINTRGDIYSISYDRGSIAIAPPVRDGIVVEPTSHEPGDLIRAIMRLYYPDTTVRAVRTDIVTINNSPDVTIKWTQVDGGWVATFKYRDETHTIKVGATPTSTVINVFRSGNLEPLFTTSITTKFTPELAYKLISLANVYDIRVKSSET